MPREIKCSFCETLQTADKDFFRIRPKPLQAAKVICDECLKEIGGEQSAAEWIIDAYAK